MATVNRKVRRFTDFDLSFAANPVTKDILFANNENAVKQSIRNLIQTINYEKKFHPEIGCQITGLLFENFEPRATVLRVDLIDNSDSNELQVTVQFKMRNVTDPLTINTTLQRAR